MQLRYWDIVINIKEVVSILRNFSEGDTRSEVSLRRQTSHDTSEYGNF